MEKNNELEYFDNNNLHMYLKEIKKYPLLNNSEFIKYYNEYKKGNMEARDKLIKSNLRLVVSIAYEKGKKISHLHMLDIIQEGNIGLMRALKTYDPKIASFSTYATLWINQAIDKGIHDKETEIRKPSYIQYKIYKYKNLINNNNKLGIKMNEEEIIKKLNFTPEEFENIKQAVSLTVTSMNKKIDDNENSELGDFLASDNNDYDNIENKIVTRELIAILKEILTSLEFYVIYERILSDKKTSLEEIGNELGVTRERVRQIEAKSLKKIKPYMDKNNNLFNKILNQIKEKDKKIDNIRLDAITPNDICIYKYMSKYFTKTESNIYKLKYLNDYIISDKDICKNCNITYNKLLNIIENIKFKFKEYFNLDEYTNFKKTLINTYGKEIYNLDNDFKLIDYEKLSKIFNNLSLEEFNNIYGEYLKDLNKKEIKLLERYFKIPSKLNIYNNEIVKNINLVIMGYKNENLNLDTKILYNTYLENKNNFTKKQQLFFECFIFNIKDKNKYLNEYGKINKFNEKYYINYLEKLYYGIDKYFENDFNLEKYTIVREKYKDKLGNNKIKILDIYYGFEREKGTISDIAALFNTDYKTAHGMARYAREFAINLYANRNSTLEVNKEKYIPYILDNNYEFTDETRNILKMILINNESYEDINKKLNISKYRISNIYTDAIRKIDFYRYGIKKATIYSKEDINNVKNTFNKLLKDQERNILIDKYINHLDIEALTLKYEIPKIKIINITTKFNKLYLKYKILNVSLTNDDILDEIESHFSESIINDIEKTILSYLYGIKCSYNNEGLKLNSKEIIDKLNISKNKLDHYTRDAKTYIKLKKIGLLHNDNCYIKRNDLDKILDDVHLPISTKEREIIYYLFELKGFPYKNFKDLESIYKENEKSLRRRYQRSILSIYKYLNKEIEGTIDYEFDIIPILKYFEPKDRLFLKDYYKNKLTYQEIAKKYDYTFNQMIINFDKLNIKLYEIINNKTNKYFDFDYYLEVVDNKDLPFLGDIELAKKIFNMYFKIDSMKKKSIPEIIDILNLPYSQNVIINMMYNLMLAVCKYKDGIKKSNNYCYKDVLNYYNINKNCMPNHIKNIFERYLNSRKDKNVNIYNLIPAPILFELLKNDDKLEFNLNYSKEEIISIIKKYEKKLSANTIESLMNKYYLTYRDFMSGKEINHIYRLLDVVYDNFLKNSNEKKLILKN